MFHNPLVDHASKSIFPNAFKVIAMQTESEREEGVQALADGLAGIVAKMGSTSPFFEGERPGYMECVLTRVMKSVQFSNKATMQTVFPFPNPDIDSSLSPFTSA